MLQNFAVDCRSISTHVLPTLGNFIGMKTLCMTSTEKLMEIKEAETSVASERPPRKRFE
jgi:hypothetical protein